jgi:hypothetical protein
MHRTSLKLSAATSLALLAGVIGSSCSKDSLPSGGDVRLAVVLPSGAAVDAVTYQVLDSSGVTIAGPASFDVSSSQAPVALDIFVPATPAGDPGDTVKLTAKATSGESCTGTSAPFVVVAGNRLAVTMTLTCGTGTPSGPSGNVGITATVVEDDHCPSITSAVASPVTMSAGGSIGVAATASDADPCDTLIYAWAPAANFTTPAASAATYICLSAGTESLTLTVSDNHTPPCSTTATLTVKCLSVDGEGGLCGDGVVGPLEQCDPPNGVTCNSTCQLIH